MTAMRTFKNTLRVIGLTLLFAGVFASCGENIDPVKPVEGKRAIGFNSTTVQTKSAPITTESLETAGEFMSTAYIAGNSTPYYGFKKVTYGTSSVISGNPACWVYPASAATSAI